MVGITDFFQYDPTSLVSREILQTFSQDLDDSSSFPIKLPLLKRRISELEEISNEIQVLFMRQFENKLPGIYTICKSDNLSQDVSPPPQLFYLNYLQKLNNSANNFSEYLSVQSYISNNEINSEISDVNSAYGFTLAMKYKDSEDLLGQRSRERIIFELKNFMDKEREISKYLIDSNVGSVLNANLRYIFLKRDDIWVVTNNSNRLYQFISNCLLSSVDFAISKRIDIAIKPYILYDKIQITPCENPLKNINISASQSLLALCRSLTFLTDLHLQIKSLDSYISTSESYISNRLMKWLNSLIISLTWDTKGMYDIVHMGLLTFYFVQLRSFLLPELASTVRHILGSNSAITIDKDGGNTNYEWRDKLRSGSEYQVNPYKGWIPGKPFKGIHIPTTTTTVELSIIANSLKELFDSID